jgi:hypothetical protein
LNSRNLILLIVVIGFFSGLSCFRKEEDTPRVSLRFKKKPRTLTTASLTCLAVNVVGDGIPSSDPTVETKNLDDSLAGGFCTYPGITTQLIPMETGGAFDLKIPAGRSRLIQVFGIESATGCPVGQNLADLMVKLRSPAGISSDYGGFYEVGRAVVDLYKSTAVNIPNTFDGDHPKDYTTCPGTGRTFTKGKVASAIHVNGQIKLAVSGGAGSPTFQVVSGGGTISSAGIFSSSTEGKSVLRATDALGRSVEHEISVFDANAVRLGPGLTEGWFIADSFRANGDNYQLVLGDTWPNRTENTHILDLAWMQNTITYRETDGPNGMPTVDLSSGYFKSINMIVGSTTSMNIYVVAKRALSTTGYFFCMTNGVNCTAVANRYAFFKSNGSTHNAGLRVGSTETGMSSAISDEGKFALHELIWNDTTNLDFRVGSTTDNASAANLTSSFFSTSGNFLLGDGGTAAGLDGSVSEILIFAPSLSATERDKVLSYIDGKYNL